MNLDGPTRDGAPFTSAEDPVTSTLTIRPSIRLSFADNRADEGSLIRGTLTLGNMLPGEQITVAVDLPKSLDYVSGDATSFDAKKSEILFVAVTADPQGRASRYVLAKLGKVPPGNASVTAKVRVVGRAVGKRYKLVHGMVRATDQSPSQRISKDGGAISIRGGLASIEFAADAVAQPAAVYARTQAAPSAAKQSVTAGNAQGDDESDDDLVTPFSIDLFPSMEFAAPVTLTVNLSGVVGAERIADGWVPQLLYWRVLTHPETVTVGDRAQLLPVGASVPEIVESSFDRSSGRLQAQLKHFSSFSVGFVFPTGGPNPWKLSPNMAGVDPFSGGVNYSFPIPAPKLQDGLGPDLSLSYSSRAGNSNSLDDQRIGFGWSLNVPSIRRGVKLNKNGNHQACPPYGECYWDHYDISKDDDYKLNLGGKDYNLVPLATVTDEFVPENYAPIRVKKCNFGVVCEGLNMTDPGSVGFYFQVWTPDGTRYVFGTDSPSTKLLIRRREPIKYVSTWLLKTVHSPIRDLNPAAQRTLLYTYEEEVQGDDGQVASQGSAIDGGDWDKYNRLKRIDYGYATSAAPVMHSVIFNYAVVAWAGYIGLKSIDIRTFGSPVRQIVLDQGWGPQETLRVFGIQEFAMNANGTMDRLPKTTFSYLADPNPFVMSSMSNGYGATKNYAWQTDSHTAPGANWHYNSYVLTADELDGIGNQSRTTYQRWNPCYVEPGRTCNSGHNTLFPEDYGSLAGYQVVSYSTSALNGPLLSVQQQWFGVVTQTLGLLVTTKQYNGANPASVLASSQTNYTIYSASDINRAGTAVWMTKPGEYWTYPNGDIGSTPSTSEQYAYDAYGGMTRKYELGYTGYTGDERTTHTKYASNTTAWIIEKPYQVTLYGDVHTYDDAASMVNRTFLYYDGLGYATIGTKGQLTTECVDVTLTTANMLCQTAAYSGPHGQLNAITDPRGNQSSVLYDSTGQFVIESRTPTVAPINQQLATKYFYQGINETVTGQTVYGGDVTKWTTNGGCTTFGSDGAQMNCTGGIAATLYFDGSGAHLVRVLASGTPVAGVGPQMSISFNGIVIATHQIPGDGIVRAYAATIPASVSGSVAVSFDNDAYAAPEDRNLRVVSVGIDNDGNDTPFGTNTRIQDPNGNSNAWRYDAFGRPRLSIRPLDTVLRPTQESVYQDYNKDSVAAPWYISSNQRATVGAGQLSATTQGWGWAGAWFNATNQPDPSAVATYARTYYDGLGRVVQNQSGTATAYDAVNGEEIIADTRYDALGRSSWTGVPYSYMNWYRRGNAGQGNGNLYTTPDLTKPRTTTTYDSLGRVTGVTGPDGVTNRQNYFFDNIACCGHTPTNALMAHGTTDANNHIKHYLTDGLGRTLVIREYTGGNPWTLYAITNYGYDATDALKWVKDNNGNTTTITYDPAGRKTAMSDPDMGSWTYGYDANGNLTSQTDAKNQTLTFEYDSLNRHTYTKLNGIWQTVRAYDIGNGLTGSNLLGRLSIAQANHSGSSSPNDYAWDYYAYDPRGRISGNLKHADYEIGTYQTNTSYDAADRNVTVTYPDGELVTTAYNAAGQPSSLVSNWGVNASNGTAIVSSATYNQLGALRTVAYGNSTKQSNLYYGIDVTYNSLFSNNNLWGKLRRICVLAQSLSTDCEADATASAAGVTQPMFNLAWDYDAVGNVRIARDSTMKDIFEYTYDELDRLKTAGVYAGRPTDWNASATGFPQSYAYDAIGNITSKSDIGGYDYQTWGGCTGYRPHALRRTLNGSTQTSGACYDANGNTTWRYENWNTGKLYLQTWTGDNKISTSNRMQPIG